MFTRSSGGNTPAESNEAPMLSGWQDELSLSIYQLKAPKQSSQESRHRVGSLLSRPYSRTAQPMSESWRMVQALSSTERMGKEFIHAGIPKPSPNELLTSRWSLREFGSITVTPSPHSQDSRTMNGQFSLSILLTQLGESEQAQGSIHIMKLTMPTSFRCANSFVAIFC